MLLSTQVFTFTSCCFCSEKFCYCSYFLCNAAGDLARPHVITLVAAITLLHQLIGDVTQRPRHWFLLLSLGVLVMTGLCQLSNFSSPSARILQ